ncbi:hypothetical protein TWF481_000406 [Arthrobotrys musiformis]|uniref:CBM1 domain-containing protein n=1 Tax=Arthrobotrys musiformis TaxID=47236 RepID=A0AAV9WMN9_9PEZI
MRLLKSQDPLQAFLFLTLSTHVIALSWIELLMMLTVSRATSGKRSIKGVDAEDEGTFWLRDMPQKQVLEKLKRQEQPATCNCFEALTETYFTTVAQTYFAMPFEPCTISASTSNLCPTGFLCACQYNETSICLPTAVRSTTDCGNPYLGPTTYPPTNFTWSLSSALPQFAFPSEQCGGTLAAAATLSWNPIQTLCPASQSCACQTASRFSRCIDNTELPAGGIPADCLTCRYEFNYDLPPPSATARLGGQCGGKCWTGPTNCPTSATCFTEKSPTPGGYAECAHSNPSRRLKVRQEGHEVLDVNLPARVQAIATPIYF